VISDALGSTATGRDRQGKVVNRRRFLAALAGTATLGGCTGGRGDQITALAVNKDDRAHSVTAWIARRRTLAVVNEVEVPSRGGEKLGDLAWKQGDYRVTVRLDGDVAPARSFRSDRWFNQLDVVVDDDGTAELNRGRAA
jgi:hypothetical protein